MAVMEPAPVVDGDGHNVLQQPLDDNVAQGASTKGAKEHETLVASLPKEVQQRVHALRSLQDQQETLSKEADTELLKQFKSVLLKYEKLYRPLYADRAAIVSGATQGDAASPPTPKATATDNRGIPGFWARALRNHPQVALLVQPRDLPALAYLVDVKSATHEHGVGFTVEFVFGENPFFANAVLTTVFNLDEDTEDLMEPTLRDVIGTAIKWKDGHNLCCEAPATTGSQLTGAINKKCDSFFHFFTPDKTDDEELRDDLGVGVTIHWVVVPKALLWFTGEAVEEDEEEDNSPTSTPRKRRKTNAKPFQHWDFVLALSVAYACDIKWLSILGFALWWHFGPSKTGNSTGTAQVPAARRVTRHHQRQRPGSLSST